jgi:hypothetical protein
MTRILFIFLFTATLTITAFSQTQNQPENAPVCGLSLSQAPAIRGIRLGMKPDEWLKLFPGSAQDEKIKAMLDQPPRYPNYGSNSITFNLPSGSGEFRYLPSEEFLGVNYVELHLIDNQIAGFAILYARSPVGTDPWDNVSQLVAIFSKTFKLPDISVWRIESFQRATLQCSGFELTLETYNAAQPRAILRSKSDLIQVIQQRRETDKQKGRAAFKP